MTRGVLILWLLPRPGTPRAPRPSAGMASSLTSGVVGAASKAAGLGPSMMYHSEQQQQQQRSSVPLVWCLVPAATAFTAAVSLLLQPSFNNMQLHMREPGAMHG